MFFQPFVTETCNGAKPCLLLQRSTPNKAKQMNASSLTASEHLAHIFTQLNASDELGLLMFLDDLSANLEGYSATNCSRSQVAALCEHVRQVRGSLNRSINTKTIGELENEGKI